MPSTLARAVHRTVDRGAKNLSYTPVNAAEDQADSIAADASRARRRCRGECEEMTVNDKDADRRTARVALFPPPAPNFVFKDKYTLSEESNKCIQEIDSLKKQLDELANSNWDVDSLFVDRRRSNAGC